MRCGKFPDEIAELVNKKNVIFCNSAGNDGPCLSTMKAAAASNEAPIGIGAVFSPRMLKMEYGYAEIAHAQAYSWSSRGPTLDGAMGVKICAPGGAISPVPRFNLSKNQLMNGTSMAAPNTAGNIACLLSGLKQLKMPYTANTLSNTLFLFFVFILFYFA